MAKRMSKNYGKKVAVNIQFDLTKMTAEQKKTLRKITLLMSSLGITYDTGTDGDIYDWEWDYSLSGPVRVSFKGFEEN